MGLLLTNSEDMASDIERKKQEEHFMKKAQEEVNKQKQNIDEEKEKELQKLQ